MDNLLIYSRRIVLPLPSGEVDVSLRTSGEGARIELNAGALTRARRRVLSRRER